MLHALTLVVGVLAGTAHAQCNATQLCPAGADPCVVAAPCTLPGGSIFDLGARELVIDGTTLTLALDKPFPDAFIIRARAVTLTPGARIVAEAHGLEQGPWLGIGVTGDFRMQSDGTRTSRIDLGGSPYPQFVEISADGSIALNGTIAIDAGQRNGIGGEIILDAAGDLVVEGAGLSARGGDDGNLDAQGREATLVAGGSVRLHAPLDVSGAECSPCQVNLEAAEDVIVTGDIDVRATDRHVGSGGWVEMEAWDEVVLEGSIHGSARGSRGPEEGLGGEGGAFVAVGTAVHLRGDVRLPGAAPDGTGGFVDVLAGQLEIDGMVDVSGPGTFGFGGDVLLDSDGALAIDGVVDASGEFFGGRVEAEAWETLTVAGRAAAAGEVGSLGVTLEGCDVGVRPGARLEGALRRGNVDPIELTARGTMTIAGELLGPSSANLRFRDWAPIIQPTAVFEQPPTLEQVPSLPCCGACVPCAGLPDDTVCDDGDACTSGERCSAGVCSPAQMASCGACELCDGTGGCVAAPRPHCRLAPAGGGTLKLRRGASAASDSVSWRWKGIGETTVDELGNPAADTDVALCLFDDIGPSPALLLRATAPAGGVCGKRPCWGLRSGSSGVAFSFRDPSRAPEGVASASLKTSASGRDQMRLVAKGMLLQDRPPALPLAGSLRAQLQASDGGCWETRHE